MDNFQDKIKNIPSTDGFKNKFSEQAYIKYGYLLRRYDISDNEIIGILKSLYAAAKSDIDN